MSLPRSLISPGRTYTRLSPSGTLLSRRVLVIGTREDTTPSICIRPLQTAEKAWVRYETWINGLRMERSCTLAAFARWGQREAGAGTVPV